ncbi:hypothetical protein BC628DRAFT_1417155 [Trametes gibbosa]|nr:hypothetical protein BC628DRAFT_1417155 [Trametes gibbosa]
MSKPPIVPETTTAGIALDPRTLERVIPESRRPDGSVRKQLKIRPGYTPQEDVRRFRGSRQQQMDATSLPKGHVVGWTPAATVTVPVSKAGMSKAQKKNEKRKEKRKEKRDDEPKVKDNWDDEDDEEGEPVGGAGAVSAQTEKATKGTHTPEKPNWAVAPSTKESPKDAEAEGLVDKLEKLEVR